MTELLRSQSVDTVQEDCSVVVGNEEGLPCLEQLLLQVIHNVCCQQRRLRVWLLDLLRWGRVKVLPWQWRPAHLLLLSRRLRVAGLGLHVAAAGRAVLALGFLGCGAPVLRVEPLASSQSARLHHVAPAALTGLPDRAVGFA